MRTPDRWVLVRAGIVNLFEYDDQVFELADGRLLLRGHNTSGKTKALELLLPFCLDGEISPRKLDPFAKTAKEMKWNLVGCVEAEQRIGYAWLEFARLGADGLEYVSAGVGLKANRGRDGVQRWYFLVRGRRVGHELSVRRGDYPLTRREFAEQLADGDELLGSPGEYRRRLNDLVFGFPSMTQYETMISLLLELRRPHLSKALNAADVGTLLSGSLPEIDHDLMRRLGEGLEQLDDLQGALRTVEAVRERVDDFSRSSYRAYARAAIAERGERLRRSDTAHTKASAARRTADEELDAARAAAGEVARKLASTRDLREAADGKRSALLQSPEWTSVAEVEQLGRTAGLARVVTLQVRERADEAAARAAADETDALATGAAADHACSALAHALAELGGEAVAAGLGARHEAAASGFEDGERTPEPIGDLLRDEAERRQLVLEEHHRLLEAVAATEVDYEQARVTRDEAAGLLRAAGDRRAALDADAQAEGEALCEAIEGWAAELRELQLEPAVIQHTLELASAAGVEGAAVASTAWQPALAERRDGLVAERSRVEAERDQLGREREALEEARVALAAERDEPPPRPHTRPAEREGRPGAPLWQLLDFAPAVPAGDRAGIEAALEGAGLLDAWVLPEGTVLDPETLDVILQPAASPTPAAALADSVVAVDDRRVERHVVERILASIALSDVASEATVCAVSRSGEFRLGPARGRFAKPAAEYVGVAARAARRARRIAELDGQLAALSARDDDVRHAVDGLQERLAALAEEAASFPDAEPLARVRRAFAEAERREAEARAELREREAAAEAAAERRAHGRTVAAGHAESCALPPDLDRATVRQQLTAVHRYQAGVGGAVAAAAHRHDTARRLTEVERRLASARAAVDKLVQAATLADADARRLEAEHAEREAALGRTGEEIRARMHDLEATLGRLREEIATLEEADKAAAVAVTQCEGRATAALEALNAEAHEREAALGAFRRLGGSDLFGLGLEADAPADVVDAAEWTLTRALELLRSLPSGRLAVRSSLLDLANRVQQRCGELDRALAQLADMAVAAEHDGDGLLIVRIRQGARTLTVPELMQRLEAEIDERERTLSAEQRRIFNDTLLEEIAEHLRERIERVTELVADMNATLVRSPTGSGKTVQLDWAAAEDGGGELRTVTRLLRRSVVTLGEAERGPLIAFFRDRIQRTREEVTIGAPSAGGGAAAHLRSAFDYRDWFAFTLYELKDGQRTKLTAKRHALGSGGEQAVLIHMPLLAAAAALYSSSSEGRAPRLVMLDEALSGIDDSTREKLLGVLVALDLDVVMTSHELWGTYRTVPSLSIYQLHRENGAFGIATEHFLWDGESLRELEQASVLE